MKNKTLSEVKIYDRKRLQIIDLTEIFILLMLPLPFFSLNILYVVTAITIILLSKYFRKEKWTDYGFKPLNLKNFLAAIIIGIAFGFIDNYLTAPLINKLAGAKPDLSSFGNVQGNIGGLIGMLAIGWLIGGIFEETFFRGYLFHRFSLIISNPLIHKITCILIISFVFSFAHTYQGISGIIGTFIFSVVISFMFFLFRQNVIYLILIHGFYDTIGIFKMFIGE
jgi:membrane protease YdiL (CAAX protease family)